MAAEHEAAADETVVPGAPRRVRRGDRGEARGRGHRDEEKARRQEGSRRQGSGREEAGRREALPAAKKPAAKTDDK